MKVQLILIAFRAFNFNVSHYYCLWKGTKISYKRGKRVFDWWKHRDGSLLDTLLGPLLAFFLPPFLLL